MPRPFTLKPSGAGKTANFGRGRGRSVVASQTPVVGGGGGGGVTPWFVEDFSSYGSIAAIVGTPPGDAGQYTGPFGGNWTSVYRDSGGSYTLDTDGVNIDGFSLAQSMRVNFPDSTALAGTRCDNFTMRPVLSPAFGTQRRLWFEFYIRFPSNWTTKTPSAWGCSNQEDHKTWLMDAMGGSGRWEIKFGNGTFNDGRTGTKVGDPIFGQQQNGNLANYSQTSPDEVVVSDNLWNNQWHRVRAEIDLGTLNTANGAYRVWINDTQIHNRTGINYGGITGFGAMQMGANRNRGQDGAMQFSWGLIRIYNTDPGWLT